MSRHNYTNPAFCQNSEFYPVPSSSTQRNFHKSSLSINGSAHGGPLRIQRSESTRSFHTAVRKTNGANRSQQNFEMPPRPGPKPLMAQQLNRTCVSSFDDRQGSGRYALVPVEELPTRSKDRYAIIPVPEFNENPKQQQQRRYTKSQDNIDRYAHLPVKDEPSSSSYNEESNTFTSLPPIPIQDNQSRMKSAFSSDFGNSSFVIVDKKSNQRYAMVPTAEDEEIVDDNHEIIQMYNGRAHRYAMIPTDEEETCLSTSDLNQSQNYSIIQENLQHTPMQTSTPQKQSVHVPVHSHPGTPIKNPAATRKLHELLSTPRKTQLVRKNSTPANSNDVTPKRYQSQPIYISTVQQQQPQRKQELTPQRLQYETNKQAAYLEARTTAIITPRLAHNNQIDVDNCSGKTWDESYPQKVANATATLGVISLMLTIGSALNSGLSLYMIAHMGRSFYLEFSLAAAFSGVGLGILGFRSRHCEWLPNRSYVSGYILVTVFCLLKCCGLLVLLALNPYPGYPLHDVTTGVILGLSTFTIFFIGLGVLGSYWCYRPPPDNRVNVY